jgi:hypothetical protein
MGCADRLWKHALLSEFPLSTANGTCWHQAVRVSAGGHLTVALTGGLHECHAASWHVVLQWDFHRQRRPDGRQPPDCPLGHQPAGQDGLGVVALHEPLHDHPAGRLGGGKALGRVGGAGRERLLAQHVLAGLQGQAKIASSPCLRGCAPVSLHPRD